MPYSDRMQKSHRYTVYFAPRGYNRIADLGMQIAQQYLSPFDRLIGVIGESGSGKSMLVKGMFPGLELTNDDEGVNIRPLPILSVDEEETGFYTPHTYHVDIRFESAFTQMHEIAAAIQTATSMGKRVIVEHFDLIFPFLDRNAHLLIGVGEEVLITRPTIFGPKPEDICDVVFKSIQHRRMTHTAEDICAYYLRQYVAEDYIHSDVRHGFVFSFFRKPEVDLDWLENMVNEDIKKDLPVSFYDDNHIKIGENIQACSGPRMHVKSTGEIGSFSLTKEFYVEPITERFLLVGIAGEKAKWKIGDLNSIIAT